MNFFLVCLGLLKSVEARRAEAIRASKGKKFLSDIKKINSILYFIEGPKYVRQATVGQSESIPRFMGVLMLCFLGGGRGGVGKGPY